MAAGAAGGGGEGGAALPEVEWRVPVGCDFSGFFVEVALSFVPFLAERLPVWLLHEGCPDAWLDGKLTAAEAAAYRRLQRTDAQRSPARTRASIAIEHGNACLARKFPAGRRPRYTVMRAMTEGALHRGDASCMLARNFDEFWLPTDYHVEVFANAGIPRDKLLVVPEAVSTEFFDPALVPPATRAAWRASAAVAAGSAGGKEPFTFCSVFKWEQRKGWDVLLRGYWAEFRERPRGEVLLRLRSYVPHWEQGPRSVRTWLSQFAAKQPGSPTVEQLPAVEVFESELSREELRAMYAASDAFVLPTRGEGWGLPVVEAMAMELPVIVTDFSGPQAYLTPANSFPLKYTGKGGSSAGQVEPDVTHLRKLLRHVATAAPAVLSEVGKAARSTMVERFSPEVVLSAVEARLRDIGAGRGAGKAATPAADWRWPPLGAEAAAGAAGKISSTATPRAGTGLAGRESSKAEGGAAEAHPPPLPQPRPPPPSSSGARRGAAVTVWGAWVLASALGLVLWAGREAYRYHVQRRKEKKCDHFNKVL